MSDHVDFILKQWRTQRPDLDTSPMAILGRLARLARIVGPELERTFAEYDLDRASFDVLATLTRSGPPHHLSPADLMQASMITSGAVTQRLDRLEARGLITRAPSESDGRGVRISLTDTGRELINRALPAHLATENRILSGLNRKQRNELAALLRQLLESLGDS